jgi:hypothetical protein
MANQGFNQVPVEKKDAGTCVKGLFYNIRVGGLARSGEVDLDPVQVGPLVEHAPGELRSIIHPQALGPPPQPDQGIERLGHLKGAEVGSRRE